MGRSIIGFACATKKQSVAADFYSNEEPRTSALTAFAQVPYSYTSDANILWYKDQLFFSYRGRISSVDKNGQDAGYVIVFPNFGKHRCHPSSRDAGDTLYCSRQATRNPETARQGSTYLFARLLLLPIAQVVAKVIQFHQQIFNKSYRKPAVIPCTRIVPIDIRYILYYFTILYFIHLEQSGLFPLPINQGL